jgi:hypothetical protein
MLSMRLNIMAAKWLSRRNDDGYKAQAILHVGEKERIWQGGALNLSQAKPAPKQPNLFKLTQSQRKLVEYVKYAHIFLSLFKP